MFFAYETLLLDTCSLSIKIQFIMQFCKSYDIYMQINAVQFQQNTKTE